jgi:PAS domain S-box-containing protein
MVVKKLPKPIQTLLYCCSHPSLRGILIVPYVLQIVLAVGITGYLSFRNGQRAIDDLSQQLQSEISDRVEQKLSNYLDKPHLINALNVEAVRSERLDITDLNDLGNYLFRQQQQFPDLTFIAFAMRNGDYVGLGDRADGLRLGILDFSVSPDTRVWSVDENGQPDEEQATVSGFVPQERDWYRVAVEAGNSFWAPPFFAFDTQELLLSAADRIYDADGNFVGVVNATLSLEQISEFLSTLEVGKTGQAFILDRDGYLVATPRNDELKTSDDQRLRAVDSENPLIRCVAEYLNTEFDTLQSVNNGHQAIPRIDRKHLSVQVQPFRDGRGLDWLIVTVVPRSDFMAEIVASTRTTILLCLVALGVAIVVGIRTSQWIAAPIAQLGIAATALSKGDWQQHVDTQRPDELGTLARAFDEMRSQLKQAQLGLEHKIQERTQELRESEEKFSKAFRLSPEPLAIAAYDNERILDVNDSFLEFSGFTRDEVVGKTGRELHLWDNPADLAEAIHRMETQGMVRNMEIRYRTKQGNIRTVLFSAEVIELRREPCVLCVLSDITELKQVAIVLQEAKTAAENANRAKSAFLASMSHELRTPLNAILGFTQLMQRNAAYASASSELSIINRSGEHLLTLINDILDMSKIEAGQTTLDITAFDFYALLDTIEAMFRLRAQSKGLQLWCDRTPDVPRYLYGDAQKIRQVLINLLGNAIKFTTVGWVQLSVSVQAVESSRDATIQPSSVPSSVPTESDRITLAFAIRDTGPGIASNEQDQLFKPFVQTEAGRQSTQGTGLGLTISRKFVQLMGGDIHLNTAIADGSEFRFSVVAWRASSDAVQPPESERHVVGLAEGQPTYSMLVVDEVPENRLLLRRLLEPVGFEVFEAAHGKEAIAQWQAHRPALIWMDMRMPVMDGYAATRHIKSSPGGQQTIIIALTASALDQDREKILQVGCDDFIRKPFREATMWDTIATHLKVEYVYDTAEEALPTSDRSHLSSDDLNVMPASWCAELHAAAISGDDMQALNLIRAIPAEHQRLAIALQQLVHDVRLDVLSDLLHPIVAQRPDDVSIKRA